MSDHQPDPSEAEKWKPKRKKFLDMVWGRRDNQPARRWKRAKITKIWENPFILRAFELIVSTMIAGIFIESSIPLEGYANLALHTGICGPIIPIFALFSSSVMLDRNPKSVIVTQMLLGISAGLYFMTIAIFALKWPLFNMNRTKYLIAIVSMTFLASVALILLIVDFLLAWIMPCCKLCCSKEGKEKKEETPKASEQSPPTAQPPA